MVIFNLLSSSMLLQFVDGECMRPHVQLSFGCSGHNFMSSLMGHTGVTCLWCSPSLTPVAGGKRRPTSVSVNKQHSAMRLSSRCADTCYFIPCMKLALLQLPSPKATQSAVLHDHILCGAALQMVALRHLVVTMLLHVSKMTDI